MTYTREQILSMPAGKELDKIAAGLIGYVSLWNYMNPDGTLGHTPKYSTDISAAWSLVEKIQKSHEVLLHTGQMDDGGLGWRVQFASYDERYNLIGFGKCISQSAPEAITKAAILAMMESGGTGE